MNPTARPTNDANEITIHDLLNLPDDERHVLNWMQKQTACSFSAIVVFLKQSEDHAHTLLEKLQQKGFVTAIATASNETLYQVCLTSMRRRRYQQESSSLFDLLIDED